MNNEEIQEMMKKDSVLDYSNLDEEALNTPNLHCKWYGIYLSENRVLKNYEFKLSKLKKEKFEYYTGRSDDAVYEEKPLFLKINKQDLELYVDADEEYQILQGKVFIQSEKVKMILDFIKNVINCRSFFIRDAISFIRFKNGLN